jgi:hypothetical protein
MHTTAGLEQGLRGGAPKVEAAMLDLAPSSEAMRGKTGGAPGGGGGKMVHVTVSPGAIVIQGVQGADGLEDLTTTALAQALERAMLQRGA